MFNDPNNCDLRLLNFRGYFFSGYCGLVAILIKLSLLSFADFFVAFRTIKFESCDFLI